LDKLNDSRITLAEVTVALKLNQGTKPEIGVFRFRGSFFVSFLEKQKRKSQNIENICLTKLYYTAARQLYSIVQQPKTNYLNL
jgi:hypothetical protein